MTTPNHSPKRRARASAPLYIADRPCQTIEAPAPVIRGPEDAVREFWSAVTAPGDREWFVALYLNSRHAVIRAKVVSVGSLNASIVHPREVYREAIANSAASVVILHNHPSGDPTPSEEDVSITRRLEEGGRLLGIQLLDHVVTASAHSWVSCRERGILGGR